MQNVQTGPGRTLANSQALRATFAIVLSANLGCALFAAYNARGLYLDGFYLFYRIAERGWFYLDEAPARITSELLRQAPIVVLTKYTDLSLIHRGQIFSLVMSALPALLTTACWFIAPPERRSWVLFPLTYLLIGVSAVSFMPITEASSGSAYFWVLLFLLLFRTRRSISQGLFLALCIPAFKLTESACLLMPVLLLACTVRAQLAVGLEERIFLAVSAALIASITIYQASWVLWPRVPGDRDLFLSGLRHLEFLRYDGHVNLPFATGVMAFAALTGVFVMALVRPRGLARASRAIAFGFAIYALAAVAAAFLVEQSLSPYSHYHARYFPVLISLVLGTTAVWLYAWVPAERAWMQPEILSVLIFLCVAQAAADVAATLRWGEFVTDLQSRLSTSSGLIPWERTERTGDTRRDLNWRLFVQPAGSYLLPIMSVVWAKNGVVMSMIDSPVGETVRLVDPEKPDELPTLRGINFRPYIQALAAQRKENAVRATLTAAALDLLADRAVAGKKIALQIDHDPAPLTPAWSETLSIIAAMNRNNEDFLCVERSSWEADQLGLENYRCKASDKISEILYVAAKDKSHNDRIAKLAGAEIIPTRPPAVASQLKPGNLDGVGAVLLGDWSDAEPGGIWSDGSKASVSFDTSRLPPRFAISIQAHLFPDTPPPAQIVKITDGGGRQLAILTNNPAQDTVNARIELAKPASGSMMTVNFEIVQPVAPRDIGVNQDSRRLGIWLEQLSFEN